MTPPPPAEQLASRILLGPALRTQPDRRLVTLVREGYEAAFEEIVRRYRRPLDRFAASFVGGRSEDVTQDAFSKALLALRGSEAEIELGPWLYRIVRNTALNDLRDRPPSTEELGEALAGGRSAAAEAEGREEMAELMGRLRALPEPQRAAIVMRELEGLSHEEIAASLGLSGGAARQAIYRARQTLRGGFGMLVPLPLLRALFAHGNEAAGAGAGGAVAAAGAAGGGSAGAVLGGLGAGGALKVGLATALIAGSVGAGVALDHGRGEHRRHEASMSSALALPVGDLGSDGPSARRHAFEDTARREDGTRTGIGGGDSDERRRGGRGHRRSEAGRHGDGISTGGGDFDGPGFDGSSRGRGDGSGSGGSSEHGGGGSGDDGDGGSSGSGKHSGPGSSEEGPSDGGQSGRHGSGGSGGGSGGSDSSSGPGGSGGSRGSDESGSDGGSNGGGDDGGSSGGGSGGGSDGGGAPASEAAPVTAPAPIEEAPAADGGGPGDGDSGSHDGIGGSDSSAVEADS